MDNVIPFPEKGKAALSQTLQKIRGHYATAGLSAAASAAAIEEVTQILEKYLDGEKAEFVMEIPECGLNQEQIGLITAAHNKCVQDVFAYHYRELGLALIEIAGLVGAKYATS